MAETYKALAEPLPEAGIQRTKAAETRKGYDTTGYGYQYAVNRFNEVCGLDGWGYFYTIVQSQEGTFQSGTSNWSIVAEVTIWVGNKENQRTMPGSHLSRDYGDALKGAITNAFKKTAAMWGVGRQAYEGAIDEDNLPTRQGPAQAKPKVANTPTPKPTSPLVQAALEAGATLEKPQAWKPNCPDHGTELRLYPSWNLGGGKTAPKWTHREASMPSGWCAWDESDLTRNLEAVLVEGRRQQPMDDEPPLEEEQ